MQVEAEHASAARRTRVRGRSSPAAFVELRAYGQLVSAPCRTRRTCSSSARAWRSSVTCSLGISRGRCAVCVYRPLARYRHRASPSRGCARRLMECSVRVRFVGGADPPHRRGGCGDGRMRRQAHAGGGAEENSTEERADRVYIAANLKRVAVRVVVWCVSVPHWSTSTSLLRQVEH
jgi:hypothetical protein